jgi:hypothetical protein
MGTFTEVDPSRRLEFSWDRAPGAGQAVLAGPRPDELLPPGASRIRVILEEREGGTALRLEHHDLPEQALRDAHLTAWQAYLARLAVVVAGETPAPTRMHDQGASSRQARLLAMTGSSGPPGRAVERTLAADCGPSRNDSWTTYS